MRVRLNEGKQKELILLARGNMGWTELSKILEIPVNYLSGDLRYEKVLISKKLFGKLCEISGKNYESCVLEILEDNWGKSKGGFNSQGSTIDIKIPKYSSELAEFIGAVLGDGHVHYTKKSLKARKIGVYQIRITGDLRYEKEYHNYLGELSKLLFGINPKYACKNGKNERYLFLSSRKLVEFFMGMGINPGNKIVNQSTIPKWVYENREYMKACLRGLIDTDGSIHRMSKRDFNLLRISFTNHDNKLLQDTRALFVILGYCPSKIINNRNFYISGQGEIEKYLKEIGFSNKKHVDRYKQFKAL
ncbi:MAG: hypothetical protein KKF50_04985 [Nanoarchaeota archaeon]|nr:hypothetical protein [Nanoarchaeota archaeon]